MRIIINADDFGRSAEINAAVIRAYREGVLTSASLMVAGEAMEEAVALARAHPGLAVGLHLAVSDGRTVLPPAEVPHLVDGRGLMPADPFLLGLRYAFCRAARRELWREMEAQFARFTATGLPLSHVDCHMHLHVHPAIFKRLLPLAVKYGARGVRLPRDTFRPAFLHGRGRRARMAAWFLTFGLLCLGRARRLRGLGLAAADRVHGLLRTGAMDEAYVLEIIARAGPGTTEIYFHPSLESRDPLGPNPGDLATLLSPAVRRAIEERGLIPAAYADIQSLLPGFSFACGRPRGEGS